MSLHIEPAYSPACGLTGGRQQSVWFQGARGVLVNTPSQKNAVLDIRTGRMLPSKARQDRASRACTAWTSIWACMTSWGQL
jgi:hypothetical protein